MLRSLYAALASLLLLVPTYTFLIGPSHKRYASSASEFRQNNPPNGQLVERRPCSPPTSLYLTPFPPPGPSGKPKRSTGDLYDSETLEKLLDLHKKLDLPLEEPPSSLPPPSPPTDIAELSSTPGLFDFVRNAVEGSSEPAAVKAIACDVDGTLIPRGSRVPDPRR